MLYELATGVRPFTGPADGAVFDAILRHNPPPASQLRPELDTQLEALIHRLLEKEPEFRFQTAADLRSSLKRLTRDSSSRMARAAKDGQAAPLIPAPPGASGRRFRRFRIPAGLIVGIGAVVVALWLASRGRPLLGDGQTARLPGRFERLTSAPGEETFPNLSPDGSQFFYAGAATGNWDIYLQRTGGSTVVNLTADSKDDDTQPALSRDGTKIAFRSERNAGGLYVMEVTGENPRRVSSRGHLPAWAPDGKLWSTLTPPSTSPARVASQSAGCIFSIPRLERIGN